MHVVQVNASDSGGGAQRISMTLHREFRRRSVVSTLAVGRRDYPNEPGIIQIDEGQLNRWQKWWSHRASEMQPSNRTQVALRLGATGMAFPKRIASFLLGHEDFHYPSSWRLLEADLQSSILHLHNLHGGYFDLRALPNLSAKTPTVITLHDAWLLSGHCAHSLDCERFVTGCGSCPYPNVYPKVIRDATARNWRVKRRLYDRARFSVVTPSRWLMTKVESSILARSIIDARVINNGIDVGVFSPGVREESRRSLGISPDSKVLAFAANYITLNPWKDFETLKKALAILSAEHPHSRLLLLALGEKAPPMTIGDAEVRFVDFVEDPKKVAEIYRSADIYVHPSRADTFPNSVIEALACGVPVVASAVGGIPEQLEGWAYPGASSSILKLNRSDLGRANGVLVPVASDREMAMAIGAILADSVARDRLAENAVSAARLRFNQERMVEDYLSFYEECIRKFRSREPVVADNNG